MATNTDNQNDNDVIIIPMSATEYIEFCAYRQQFIGRQFTFDEKYGKGIAKVKGTRAEFKELGYEEEKG